MRKQPKLVDDASFLILFFMLFFLVAFILTLNIALTEETAILSATFPAFILEIVMISIFIKHHKKRKRIIHVFERGTKATASFVNSIKFYRKDSSPVFKIEFIYSHKGVPRTFKSSEYYSLREMEYLKNVRLFEVRYEDDICLITEDFFSHNGVRGGETKKIRDTTKTTRKPENIIHTDIKRENTRTELLQTLATVIEEHKKTVSVNNDYPSAEEKSNSKPEVRPTDTPENMPDSFEFTSADALIEQLKTATEEQADALWNKNAEKLNFADYIKVKRVYESRKNIY